MRLIIDYNYIYSIPYIFFQITSISISYMPIASFIYSREYCKLFGIVQTIRTLPHPRCQLCCISISIHNYTCTKIHKIYILKRNKNHLVRPIQWQMAAHQSFWTTTSPQQSTFKGNSNKAHFKFQKTKTNNTTRKFAPNIKTKRNLGFEPTSTKFWSKQQLGFRSLSSSRCLQAETRTRKPWPEPKRVCEFLSHWCQNSSLSWCWGREYCCWKE